MKRFRLASAAVLLGAAAAHAQSTELQFYLRD
jgi:hypothetical protein